MSGPGHNSGSISRDVLRSFIQRIERLDEEIAGLNADKSDIYKEAKAQGFDAKAMRKVVQRRRAVAKSRADVQEQDALISLYLDAVGEG